MNSSSLLSIEKTAGMKFGWVSSRLFWSGDSFSPWSNFNLYFLSLSNSLRHKLKSLSSVTHVLLLLYFGSKPVISWKGIWSLTALKILKCGGKNGLVFGTSPIFWNGFLNYDGLSFCSRIDSCNFSAVKSSLILSFGIENVLLVLSAWLSKEMNYLV